MQVGKGNDSLPDCLDINFIDYLIKKFVDNMVGAMDVHALITLLKIDYKPIDAVHHEFADVECGLDFFYLDWHYA